MTIFGIVITYAVCWWMVLFMVLPWGVRMEETPQPGNAVSAPARPRLRRKLGITSLLATLPTLLFYIVIHEAKAAEPKPYRDPDIYHTKNAGSGCKPATMPNDSAAVPVEITVPIAPYFDSAHQGSVTNNAASSQGGVGIRKGEVTADGALVVGGKRIGAPQATGECPQ